MRLSAVPFVIGLVWTASQCVGLSPPASAGIEVYYAPEDRPLDRLVRLMEKAHHSVYVAVYGISAPLIVKGLLDTKKRGIDVRVITDGGRLDDPKQRTALETLRLAGIPIRVSRHDGLMHLKQVTIDEDINVNGSMNHTTSGNKYNDERLDVISDTRITARARHKFLSMWNDHERYADWK